MSDDDDEPVVIDDGAPGRNLSRSQIMIAVTTVRDFAMASDAGIGCWLRLCIWSASNFTRGRVPGGARWSPRELTLRTGTSVRALKCAEDAGLVKRDGDDLVLSSYDTQGDDVYLSKVRGGIKRQQKYKNSSENSAISHDDTNATKASTAGRTPASTPGTTPGSPIPSLPVPSSPGQSSPGHNQSSSTPIPVKRSQGGKDGQSSNSLSQAGMDGGIENDIEFPFIQLAVTDQEKAQTNRATLDLLIKQFGKGAVHRKSEELASNKARQGNYLKPWPSDVRDALEATSRK